MDYRVYTVINGERLGYLLKPDSELNPKLAGLEMGIGGIRKSGYLLERAKG
ncbi:MAG: hypothetical protein JW991_04380 [Candidatus Pacebacteria bacterium]|nr:hypothetical protein [Candidatus Paceibacterota bacterium]